MEEQRPLVKLTDVNPYILCVLCKGYIVDATSIAECLHSFCRSCIILHLAQEDYCPRCKVQINNSKPDMYLKPDKTLQDIIYKIVPGLFHSEMKRRREHYKKMPDRDVDLHPESRGLSVDRLIYSPDEKISLSLEFCDSEKEKEIWDSTSTENQSVASILSRKKSSDSKTPPAPPPPSSSESSMSVDEKTPPVSVIKSYLNCPAAMPLYLLKRFVRNKFGAGDNDKVELIYRRESLPDYYSLMDVAYIYPWNRNEPMQFFFRIYVSSLKSNAPKRILPVPKPIKLKVEALVDKASIPSASVDNEKPSGNIADEKNKENLVENKITVKTEEDFNVMKPLNAPPVVKVEKESPVKLCGKENKAEPTAETNKIEALQKLTDNISTMVRDETKTAISNLSQSFKTPSSSSLKDIGMLTTIPIASKPPPPTPTPNLTPSPSRPVSNCVRILPKPSPSSTSFTVPKSQVLSTMTRPTHLTIRSSLPLRPNMCSSQTASHLILSAPSISRPVPSQTPVLFTTVAVPTPSPHQSQVATAVSAYNNAIKQNNIIYRANSMLLPKPRPEVMQQAINQMSLVRTSTGPDTKHCDRVNNRLNEKNNSHSKPLSRTEKVLKSAKYLNKFGVTETGEGDSGKEVRKVNAMKEYIENPRILEDLEIHAAETLLQVSRNCPPQENPPPTEQQPFKKPLPVLSPKSMPLISDTITNVPPKITNVTPKIMPNGLSKKSNNSLNRKINDIKNHVESNQTKKATFDPYDFDTSSSNIPMPSKPTPKRTIYSNNLSVNKLNSKSPIDSNDRKSGSPKLNSGSIANTIDSCARNEPTKTQDSFNLMLKSNGISNSFINSTTRNDKLDLKRSFSETERCIETEDGMLSVSLMTHDSHQHLENKKRKVEEPDVSIQLMSLTAENTNVAKKDPKDLLKRKPEQSDQNSGSNKKICFRPNGKTVEHITDMLKDKKTIDHVKENGIKSSPPTSEKKPEIVPNSLPPPPKVTKTLPKLIEINAAPFPKTPVTKTLNITTTQQTCSENNPKQELLTALDLSPSSKSPTGDSPKLKSSPKSPNDANNVSARSSPALNVPCRNSPVNNGSARSSPVNNGPARSSPVNNGPARSSPVNTSAARSSPGLNAPCRSSPVNNGSARSSPVNTSAARSSPVNTSAARSSPALNVPCRNSPVNNGPARSSPVNNGPARSSPVNTSAARSSPGLNAPCRSSPVNNGPARSSPVNIAPAQNSPITVQSKSPKSDKVKPSSSSSISCSPPKKTSPNGTEFRTIPDLVRPEYFKMLQTQNRSNNNHLQDWYKAMSVGSIPPHPLMFVPGPDSLSKT